MTACRTLSIFLSLILGVLCLGAPVLAQAAPGTSSRPIEDYQFGLVSVVPETWTDNGAGSYTRGTPPDDLAALVVQSVPATVDQLWPSLLTSLMLSEVPEPTGEFDSGALEWSLYRTDIELPELDLAVELGLAELDGTTYMLILQSAPDEFDTLRERVLVPALEATAPLAPRPTPDPSTFDYAIEDVTFAGGAEDVVLAGTLTLPAGPGPHPVLITLSGSGPSDRDESLGTVSELKPFAVLADALTSAGVGVLRYDDRGVGASTGDHAAATISDFSADAAAAIDYLESRDDVDPSRIGLFGHSEGGFYAAKLGASDPRIAFIGLMAPGVTDGATLIREQNEAMQRAMGRSPEQIQAVADYTDEVIEAVLEGDAAMIEEVVLDFYGSYYDLLSEDEQAMAGDREAFQRNASQRELAVYQTDWFRSLLAYDPVADWERVTVPVLAVFGGKDVQVVAETNAAALRQALEAAGNEDVTIVIIPDANHLFQEADAGTFTEYYSLEPEFIDGFVETVVDWAVERAGVAG